MAARREGGGRGVVKGDRGCVPESHERRERLDPRGPGVSCMPGFGAQRPLWHCSTPHVPLAESAAASVLPGLPVENSMLRRQYVMPTLSYTSS